MIDGLSPAEFVEWVRLCCFIDEDSGCWLYQRSHNDKGYPIAYGTGVRFGVRRPLYVAAIGEIPADRFVSLICGCVSCLNPAHMRAVTRSQYMHKAVGGRPRRADILVRVTAAQRRRADTKLTLVAARQIRARIALGDKYAAIAADYNCTPQNISYIAQNRTWREPSPWAI